MGGVISRYHGSGGRWEIDWTCCSLGTHVGGQVLSAPDQCAGDNNRNRGTSTMSGYCSCPVIVALWIQEGMVVDSLLVESALQNVPSGHFWL